MKKTLYGEFFGIFITRNCEKNAGKSPERSDSH
jgi:hypothetical protein